MKIKWPKFQLRMKTEYVVLLTVLLFLALLLIVYYFIPTSDLNGFITFLSGASTAGILILMFRLLSECSAQKEAGWTKPVRATGYGISNDSS